MPLNVLRPTPITENGQLLSSTATESADTTWTVGASFALGATVKYNHIRYESLQAANVGHDPETINSTWWLELGPTNHWAMFDTQTSTSTTKVGTLVVEIAPGTSINSVSVLGIGGCSSVTCEIFKGSGRTGADLIYSFTKSLDNTFISSWYQYFFEPYVVLTDLLFGSIVGATAAGVTGEGIAVPPYINCQVKLTFTATTGGTTVRVAGVLLGTTVELGETQPGASAGINDYSVKETDAYGVTTLVQRNFSKRASYTITVPNGQLRRVHSTLTALRATPCVWVASDDTNLSPLTVYGFYKDFSLLVQYIDYSTFSLEIEGLT